MGYEWSDEKGAECERATRTVLDQPGVTISLVADVPDDQVQREAYGLPQPASLVDLARSGKL
jgi:hypothetical protein